MDVVLELPGEVWVPGDTLVVAVSIPLLVIPLCKEVVASVLGPLSLVSLLADDVVASVLTLPDSGADVGASLVVPNVFSVLPWTDSPVVAPVMEPFGTVFSSVNDVVMPVLKVPGATVVLEATAG